MARVSYVARTRRSGRRVTRGAQLRCTSSDEERTGDVNVTNAPGNVVDDEHVAEADVVAPSATEPPSTTVQGATSTKKISAIRGWTKEEMLAAIDDIEFNGYSVRASAKKHTIPPSSIHYWINGLTHTKRRGPVTVMTEEEAAEVVEWCKEMAQLGHGLELIQLKSTVAQICQGRPNPFKDGFPGKSWWFGFKKRHPDLVLRTAEGLDRDRALNLRPTVVCKFYDTLSSAYDKHSYAADHIWNCDETGLQAGRNCGMRVIAKRGSRNVPKILPKSREWITILCCVNAIGASIPGFYLFKGKNQLKNYIQNCEPGACMAAHPHAWMTKELFLNWLCHFAASVPGGVSPNNRHLLILDGHGSHMALQTIEEAYNLGIDLLTLPTHTTHRLQPLDVSVFGPFKNYFRSERAAWMAKNPGVEVKRFELAELASKAFKRALTPSNIKAGFRRTRIWPLNYDALMHDTACSQAFHVDGQEERQEVEEEVNEHDDVVAADNIISLSQGQLYADDDEQVCETQYTCQQIHGNTVEHAVENADFVETEIADIVNADLVQNENADIVNAENEIADIGHEENADIVNAENEIADIGHEIENDQLSLPSQVNPPSWLAENMINLNAHSVSRTNEQSMNMPSQVAEFYSEIVHFFVDNRSMEEDGGHNEAADEENNIVQSSATDTEVPSNDMQVGGREKLLGRFLKLPVERVSMKKKQGTANSLRLGRSSQLLTSEDYIKLLVESENKKMEIQELKQKKKDQAKEKKAARAIAAQRRADERLERERARQEKEQQKQISRQEKEARKAQQMLEREQGLTHMVDINASTVNENESRNMSNTLDNIANNTTLFQDLINIQVPQYQNRGLPTCLIPTTGGLNSMYAQHTPPLNASVRYGYSIPPWMEGTNWSQLYGSNQPPPNQAFLGRPTYLAQSGNSVFGTEDSQGHKE